MQINPAWKWLFVGGLVAALGTPALADDSQELAGRLQHPAPAAGLAKAPVRAPAWCANAPRGDWSLGSVGREYDMFVTKHYWSSVIKASLELCSLDPNQPVVQQAAAEFEQQWINITGLSDKDAVASLAGRVDAERFGQAKRALCDQLKVSDEVIGEDRAFNAVHRELFGCDKPDGGGVVLSLWADGELKYADVIYYLDQSATPADELVRLAWVVDRTKPAFGKVEDATVAMYAIDSIDFRALADDKALAMLDSPPYSGNAYASVIVHESLGRAHIGIAALDAEAGKRTTDADWKELVVDAPKRALDAYAASAAKVKDELARSNAFEHALFGPSKKAVAGCEPALRKDFVAVWKKLPHATSAEAKDSLGDPLAGLLFQRLISCMAVDGDVMVAEHLRALEKRHVRGPRSAAYFATLEALGKIGQDRERFPVKPSALAWFSPANNDLEDVAFDNSHKRDRHDKMGYVGDGGKGVVKSVTKSAGGVVIAFVDKSHQEMAQECVPTNRVYSISLDGKVQYYQQCHDTHLITVKDTLDPITIAAPMADGIKAGVFVEFIATRGNTAADRWAVPLAAYADKEHKKLVNYEGFSL